MLDTGHGLLRPHARNVVPAGSVRALAADKQSSIPVGPGIASIGLSANHLLCVPSGWKCVRVNADVFDRISVHVVVIDVAMEACRGRVPADFEFARRGQWSLICVLCS